MQDSALSCLSQQQSALTVVFTGKHLLYAQHFQVLESSHCKNKPEKWNRNSKSCAFTYHLARIATRRQWDFKDTPLLCKWQQVWVIWGLESIRRNEYIGPRIPLRGWSICHIQRSADIWGWWAWRKGSEGSYLMFINIHWDAMKKREPGSFQSCLWTKQAAIGTDQKTRNGETLLLCR